ncbi:hypothetical protein PBRA_003986 [Plasmodiophora brassicae]|nr:hypothetical protein PBRA_003986 [Plasmodiophora brassicae]
MHEDVDASGTADDTEVTFHGDVVAEANYGRDGPPILLHPRRLPVKTAIAAAALFAIGIVFTLSGVFIFLNYGLYDSLPFFIIGGIGFIPGSYNSWILYQAYMGVKGYDYSQVPSYDD